MIVGDESLADRDGRPLVEEFVVDEDEVFLAGPVSRRVAILDFDPDTGAIQAPTVLRPPAGAAKRGEFLIGEERFKRLRRSLLEPEQG